MTKLLFLISAACVLPGCTTVAISDLAGRAMSHPGIETIDIRGGKLYESSDLRMRFRAVRELPVVQEVRDVAR